MPLRFIFHEVQVPCVHIDQLFIFCPYWPIFLFLFSLEHQIGKTRPVHIDQVPIFLFRNKVENLGPWCTWDKSQVVASALLHCSACLQHDALVLHWVAFSDAALLLLLQWFLWWLLQSRSFAVQQCSRGPATWLHQGAVNLFKSALFLFFFCVKMIPLLVIAVLQHDYAEVGGAVEQLI